MGRSILGEVIYTRARPQTAAHQSSDHRVEVWESSVDGQLLLTSAS